MARPRAFFIMAHHRPHQLRWLVEALDGPGAHPDDLILLHVDLKSTLGLKADRRGIWPMARALAASHPKVRLMRPRFTNWGGWSLSRVHLQAISLALDLSRDWTHFVNLSGQCFPITSRDRMDTELDAAGDLVFVELRPFATLPADDWHLRMHPMIELPHKALRLPGPRRPPTTFELAHKGAQWSILPRAFCEWQRTAPMAASIRRYLSGLLLSDELIMQTLVRNGPWRDRVAPHLGHHVVWPGPKVMGMEDRPAMKASRAFFARKFDHGRDPDILPWLAREHGWAVPSLLDQAA